MMDHCAGKATQLFSDSASDTTSPAPGWQHIFSYQQHYHQQNQQQQGTVLCPEPRRAVRVPPCLVEDNLTRLFSSVTSSSLIGVDCGFEILGVILSQEQDAADSETASYFRGTPPARTGNPLIHDSEFVNQQSQTIFPATATRTTTATTAPLAGTSNGCRRHHSAGGGAASCGSSSASSFSGKPKVRIEGFASGSSSKPPPFRVATTALA